MSDLKVLIISNLVKINLEMCLNFYPHQKNELYKTLKRTLKDKNVELGLISLLEIFYGKTLNLLYHHLHKMVKKFA